MMGQYLSCRPEGQSALARPERNLHDGLVLFRRGLFLYDLVKPLSRLLATDFGTGLPRLQA
jgi:hypothetical protein